MVKNFPTSGKKENRSLFSSIFPREYDFLKMLSDQADLTLFGVQAFVTWLKTTPMEKPIQMIKLEEEVNVMRHQMEEKLIKSFSTPFDRQDIYDLSRQMDYILNFAKETALEIYTFGVSPDKNILGMAEALLKGTGYIVEGVKTMNSDKSQTEILIRKAGEAGHEMESIYISGMAELFRTDDPMNAMRKREIYHHLRDASRTLRGTLDILNHAVVGLA
jgi:uncharacterized protein Yka (UPF0111/DUF47 family)